MGAVPGFLVSERDCGWEVMEFVVAGEFEEVVRTLLAVLRVAKRMMVRRVRRSWGMAKSGLRCYWVIGFGFGECVFGI